MERAEFAVHMLNDQGKKKAAEIAGTFTATLDRLEFLCKGAAGGREMAIVRTKLEEASFFAKKAMAVQPENQEINA